MRSRKTSPDRLTCLYVSTDWIPQNTSRGQDLGGSTDFNPEPKPHGEIIEPIEAFTRS